MEDVGDEAKLSDGWRQGGEHEVANAEGRQPGNSRSAEGRGQDEQEDLADVVVPLEIAEIGEAPQDLDDKVRKFALLDVKFSFCLVYIGRKVSIDLSWQCRLWVRVGVLQKNIKYSLKGAGKLEPDSVDSQLD
jgi:hypothetical protein